MGDPVSFTVIGEALIDLVDSGDTGPALAHAGGSPLNVAVGLARLGQRAHFAGRFSRDPFGTLLRNHATRAGVDLTRSVIDPDRPSTVAAVQLADGIAHYDFFVDQTADFCWTRAELDAAVAGADVVHFGSLTSWLPPGDEVLAGLVHDVRSDGGVLVSYDPNVRPTLQPDAGRARVQIEAAVRQAHVVKASSEDLAYIYGPGREPDDIAAHWLAYGALMVVITRGGDGAMAYLPGLAPLEQPVHTLAMVDTVGAGDSFMAGLLDGLARHDLADPGALAGAPATAIAEIVDHAAWVSAITCSRAGANPPTAEEVRLTRAGSG